MNTPDDAPKVSNAVAAPSKKKGVVRDWVESILIAAALAIFVRTFFFQIYKIPTTSMVPTLMPGDKIFVSKLVYGPRMPFTHIRLPGVRKPQRGEVVVFVPPEEAKNPFWKRKVYIKRLIGLPGERVSIREGNIFINEKMVVDPVIARIYYYNSGEYGAKDATFTIPAQKYFFLGDNSISSSDSRFWGFADEKEIVGKAIFVWWPPKRTGSIE